MKKIMPKIFSMLMIMMLVASPVVFAEWQEDAPGEHSTGGGEFELGGAVKPTQPGTAGGTVAKVIGVIQWIGYAIAIGMLVYIGIKYIMASANDKAELKNAMIKYILGAVLIAGASTIAGWIFNSSIF